MAAASARKQDLPPSGGYRPINFKRVPAKTLFNGFTLIGGYLGMTAGAAYLYYLGCKKIRKADIEMRSARFAIYPMLLAERDREYLKQLRKNRDEEANLMANVEGWKVGTYYGEPLYKTVPKDKLLEASTASGYFVHAHEKDMKKRTDMAKWS